MGFQFFHSADPEDSRTNLHPFLTHPSCKMNWAKENKFLAGYIGVMVIGVGALGFKVFTASGALTAAEEAYTTKASAYDNLRRVKPYPSRQNLAEFETQKKEAAEVIS